MTNKKSDGLLYLELGTLASFQLLKDFLGIFKGKILKSLELAVGHIHVQS